MNGRVPLDMQAVAEWAVGTRAPLRAWALEFVCDGKPFKWAGYAANQETADELAREALDVFYDFHGGAQLVACCEVRS